MKIEFANGKGLKWMLAILMLLLSIGWLLWNEQNVRIWASFELSRSTPLPDFDARKAAGLSAKRRAALERELFGEVHMWNTQSRRYHGPSGGVAREMRWRSMSDEGYELAHLALRVFEPSTGHMHNPMSALRRLSELARQGDVGAMCMISDIALRLPARGGINWSLQEKEGRAWMRVGAEAGHPECLALLGIRLIGGVDQFPLEVDRGMNMLFEAIRQGYAYWSGSLAYHFKELGLDVDGNRRLVYCWQYQDAKHSFIEPDMALKIYARNAMPPNRREALLRELEQLRNWRPAIEECIDLSERLRRN